MMTIVIARLILNVALATVMQILSNTQLIV
jgi:hypothetical protein